MKAVPRSSGSVMSESRSTPITITWRALPPRTKSEAMATPWQKPAHAAEMSKAAGMVGAEVEGDQGGHGRGLHQVAARSRR